MIETATLAPTRRIRAADAGWSSAVRRSFGGSAVVLLLESDAAARDTAAVAALTVTPSGITAVVLMFTMLIATEPAMPTSPLPAPLDAFAANSCCEFIVALMVIRSH